METKNLFQSITLLEAEMKALNNDDKEYYKRREALSAKMRDFLRTDFSALETKELLKLCGMVYTYQPIALHSFLLRCGSLVNHNTL